MNTYERDGVKYEKRGEEYKIVGIDDFDNDITEIYILDEINGYPVTELGLLYPISGFHAYIAHSITDRIYFPWSITESPIENIRWSVMQGYREHLIYIISTCTETLIDTNSHGSTKIKFVVPQLTYAMLVNGEAIDGERVSSSEIKNFLPANISYKFNYSGNSNEGYFFIDLLEESGKLTKPPYDPKREGYTFAGWYIDAECTKEWNFETDEVIINYDEEGNRIYEEFCLYAKWTE